MRVRLAAALTCALLFVSTKADAQLRPDVAWQQLDTEHFHVVFEPGLDSLARRAAARAELEFARLSALTRAPATPIELVVADNTDISNGYASVFPSNRVVIYTRPPVDELALQNNPGWIELVVTHELTHIFQLDQTGRVGRALRTVFGRAPFGWPVFPLLEQPRWNIEGLATMVESRHTGSGRTYGSAHEMFVRTAILEQQFDPIDRVSGETPIWPGGTRAYVYGSLFMDYIARRYGADAHDALMRKAAGSLLPPSWRMNAVAKAATGRSYSELYGDWQAELTRRYAALADTLRAQTLTTAELLTTTGRWATYPRISPDGRRLAFSNENGRDPVSTTVLDFATGRTENIRHNGLGPIAWLPDGESYITAQWQLQDAYVIRSDLYLVRGRSETRLTDGERAEFADVSADGARIIYVQNVPGTNRIVERDLRTGSTRTLVEASANTHWTQPRYSRDGRFIAVQRMVAAEHDIVILDADGRTVRELHTRGIDASPAWSPDGRWVVFSSDQSGISNLYAGDVQSGDVRQITNLLSGAYYPDVSPDGRTLYYAEYHADGFHIARMPFDPAAWRTPQPARDPAAGRKLPLQDTLLRPAVQLGEVRTYSALPSVLPKFWLPLIEHENSFGTFLGASTAGADDVGRHQYFASLGYDFEHGRTMGELGYSWAGLGNPVINLDAARLWDPDDVVIRNSNDAITDTLMSFEREDRVGVSATFRRPRWRNSLAVTLGAEAVQLRRRILGNAQFRDPQDRLLGAVGGVSFSTVHRPALATSVEDGVRGSAFLRRRFDIDPGAFYDASYTQLSASAAAYQSVNAFGYAHHVVVAHASTIQRSGTAVGPADVGGAISFLPVRGYASGERSGYNAWSATAEYRFPIALIGRGRGLWPVFLDRVAGAVFMDAGNASCNAAQRAARTDCAGGSALLSAGGQLSAGIALFSFFPTWVRAGVGVPLNGAGQRPRFYFAFEPGF